MPKLRCYEKQTTAKYLNRPSPPYPAADCTYGHEETGNDGNTWYIMKNKNGVGRWVTEATFWGYNKRNQSRRKSVKSRRKSVKSRRKSRKSRRKSRKSRRKSIQPNHQLTRNQLSRTKTTENNHRQENTQE